MESTPDGTSAAASKKLTAAPTTTTIARRKSTVTRTTTIAGNEVQSASGSGINASCSDSASEPERCHTGGQEQQQKQQQQQYNNKNNNTFSPENQQQNYHNNRNAPENEQQYNNNRYGPHNQNQRKNWRQFQSYNSRPWINGPRPHYNNNYSNNNWKYNSRKHSRGAYHNNWNNYNSDDFNSYNSGPSSARQIFWSRRESQDQDYYRERSYDSRRDSSSYRSFSRSRSRESKESRKKADCDRSFSRSPIPESNKYRRVRSVITKKEQTTKENTKQKKKLEKSRETEKSQEKEQNNIKRKENREASTSKNCIDKKISDPNSVIESTVKKTSSTETEQNLTELVTVKKEKDSEIQIPYPQIQVRTEKSQEKEQNNIKVKENSKASISKTNLKQNSVIESIPNKTSLTSIDTNKRTRETEQYSTELVTVKIEKDSEIITTYPQIQVRPLNELLKQELVALAQEKLQVQSPVASNGNSTVVPISPRSIYQIRRRTLSSTGNNGIPESSINNDLANMDKECLKYIINNSDTVYNEHLKTQARRRLREELRRQLKEITLEQPKDKPPIDLVEDEIVEAIKLPQVLLKEIEKCFGIDITTENNTEKESINFIKIEKTLEIDKFTTVNDQSLKESDKVTTANDQSLKESDKVTTVNDLSLKESDKVATENDQILKESDKVTTVNDQSLNESDKVTTENEHSLKESDKVTTVNDQSLKESDKVTTVNEHSFKESDKVTTVNDQSLKESDKVTTGNVQSFKESDKVKTENDQSLKESDKVKTENEQPLKESDKVTTVNHQALKESDKVTTVNHQSFEESDKVTTEHDQSLKERNKVATKESDKSHTMSSLVKEALPKTKDLLESSMDLAQKFKALAAKKSTNNLNLQCKEVNNLESIAQNKSVESIKENPIVAETSKVETPIKMEVKAELLNTPEITCIVLSSSEDEDEEQQQKSRYQEKLKQQADQVISNFEKLILPHLRDSLAERYRSNHSVNVKSRLHFISCVVTSNEHNPQSFSKIKVARIQKNLKSEDNRLGLEFLERQIQNVANEKQKSARTEPNELVISSLSTKNAELASEAHQRNCSLANDVNDGNEDVNVGPAVATTVRTSMPPTPPRNNTPTNVANLTRTFHTSSSLSLGNLMSLAPGNYPLPSGDLETNESMLQVHEIDRRLLENTNRRGFLEEMIMKFQKEKSDLEMVTLELQSRKFLLLNSVISRTTTTTVQAPLSAVTPINSPPHVPAESVIEKSPVKEISRKKRKPRVIIKRVRILPKRKARVKSAKVINSKEVSVKLESNQEQEGESTEVVISEAVMEPVTLQAVTEPVILEAVTEPAISEALILETVTEAVSKAVLSKAVTCEPVFSESVISKRVFSEAVPVPVTSQLKIEKQQKSTKVNNVSKKRATSSTPVASSKRRRLTRSATLNAIQQPLAVIPPLPPPPPPPEFESFELPRILQKATPPSPIGITTTDNHSNSEHNYSFIPSGPLLNITSPITQIRIYKDNIIAASENGDVYVFNISNHKLERQIIKHSEAITNMFLCEKESFLFTTSLDGFLKKSSLEKLERVMQTIYLKEPLQSIDIAWGVAFIGSRWGRIFTYNIATNKVVDMPLLSTGQSIITVKATKEGARRIIMLGCKGNFVLLHDAANGLLLRRLSIPEGLNVYSLLLIDGHVFCGTQKNEVFKFDFASGNMVNTLRCGNGAVAMAIYQERFLLIGCYDGFIYVLNKETGMQLGCFNGPGRLVLALAIAGDKVVASSKDNSLEILEIPSELLNLEESA